MAKIIDILVTGSNTNVVYPYESEIFVKVKDGKKIKHYSSNYSGFCCEDYYQDYYQFTPEQIEKEIEESRPYSLIKGEDKRFPVYRYDGDFVVIINNQYVFLKVEGPKDNLQVVGAYCLGDPESYLGNELYRTISKLSKFDLAKAIAKDFVSSNKDLKINLKEDELIKSE